MNKIIVGRIPKQKCKEYHETNKKEKCKEYSRTKGVCYIVLYQVDSKITKCHDMKQIV